MILIVAEKPSLGRNIAAAIGSLSKRKGYLEGEGYLVTWAFGHLFSLCDIEDYTGPTSDGRWSMENIPCFPDSFRFALRKEKGGKVDPGVREQFDTICRLAARQDVEAVVNAGDADREGEIIIRLCLEHAGEINKPLLRLWLPDQTPETIRAALAELKPESDYDNLANEGFARTYIDWLYGVNLTRFATLKTGTLLRVGRVIVPIVKAIYDRDMAIEKFTPEIYYGVSAKTEDGVEIQSKQKFSKEEKKKAEEYAALLNANPLTVKKRKAKKDKLNPGKLYSLSKLQNALGKKYKMPMDDSLRVVQALYERGYVTYPRTNSEYLATAEKDKMKKILAGLSAIGYPVAFKDKKTIFDDSKIESHSALTPTFRIPKKEELSEEEKKVYQAILRRFVAVFCSEDCVCEKTELVLAAGDVEEFTLKGTVILEKGWTRFDDATRNDKVLPALSVGDVFPATFEVREKETSPPKHYTIETLNNYLKNPFREEKARAEEEEGDDAEEYRAMFEGLELGTEATRTGIIENARSSGYIQLKKDVYTILPDGKYLIEQLSGMGIVMDKYKTATTGKALKSVFRGEMDVPSAVALAKEEIRAVFDQTSPDADTGFYGDAVGICPLCGAEVVKGKYSYGCRGYKEGCRFRVNLFICQRPIPISQAKKLLGEGTTDLMENFVSPRTGKSFSARLRLEAEGKVSFYFDS
ncbi:MAG: topoisomerase C-terminal repeat-containing protein [Clostridia bacterium]|nr:topoisomerase C-terminal repeat-containing protein [Clostridia bacterium]